MDDENYIEEKQISGQPKSISLESIKIIQEQIEKSICKIYCDDGFGTGFFCKIPFPDELHLLRVLITNNHVIDQKYIIKNKQIKISFNNDSSFYILYMNNSRIFYNIERPYDATIIEIKDYDGIEINRFLEIENRLNIKCNLNEIYKNKSIYLIHYPKGDKAEYAIGTIKDIKDYNICHICSSDKGSSGCPILNLVNYKVIGIHKGSSNKNDYNIGTLIGKIIEYFCKEKYIDIKDGHNINEINYFLNYNDEIKIIYKYKTEDRLLNSFINNIKKIKIFGDKFVEKNKNICKILINGKINELCSHIEINNISLNNDNTFQIILLGLNNIVDASYLFDSCSSLISLPDISKWDTKNIEDMSYLFCNCSNLSYISGDISNWNTSKVIDMNSLFYFCLELKSLPDLSNWDTSKVKDMSYMFYDCRSLTSLPGISNWKTNNVEKMNFMFYKCSLLKPFPDISKWDYSNVKEKKGMLYECSKKDLNIPFDFNTDCRPY